MYKYQQFGPALVKYTPIEERTPNTGWITLMQSENHAELLQKIERKYHDHNGRKRLERIISVG